MEICLKNKNIAATVNSLGAELTSLTRDNYNYIWTIDKKYWNKTSPVLFPIVGKLKDDSYTLNNTKYSLSRHGFARDFEFKLVKQSEKLATFSLIQNSETLYKYPFNFELEITYELQKTTLTISYSIKNNALHKMPFNIGAHPAFSITTIEDYSLVFDNDTSLITHELQDGLLSEKTKEIGFENNTLILSYELFKKDALIFKNIKSRTVTLINKNNPIVTIDLKDFPHLGIWTNRDAPFICIEPWYGFSDNRTSSENIFEKESIQILEPNQTFITSFSIEIL
jgi:galactose mutarotase-like enzyme